MSLYREVTEGYVIFETKIVKPKKIGDFPETVNIYLCGSEYDPWWSNDLDYAYRIIDKDEAFVIAGGLGMDVGRVEIRVVQERKGK